MLNIKHPKARKHLNDENRQKFTASDDSQLKYIQVNHSKRWTLLTLLIHNA